jgi:tetratricopeptide (TPR) repeat protein
LGQFSSALEWFEKVLVQDENDASTLNNIAIAQYNLGDVEQAVANFQNAVDNGSIDARFNLGMHHLKNHDYERALDLLEGENADAIFGRGLVYMEHGDDEKAFNCFKRVLEMIPHHAGAYYNMGFISTRMGRYEDSLSYIRKGMEIEPNYDNEKYHLSLDPALSEFGPYYIPRMQPSAIKIVDEVFKPHAATSEELLTEAEDLLSRNDADGALGKIEEALSIAPEDSRAIVLKAEILYHHEEVDAAMELLDNYQQSHPDVVAVLGSWARMLKEKGEKREAREVFGRLSDIEPDNLAWLNGAAELSYSLGDEEDALGFYRKLYEHDTNNLEANLRLLRIYVDRKQFDEAEPFLEFLGEQHQDIYEYNILAGIYWSERKDYDKALGSFDKAITIDSSQPLPYYHRGLLNVQRGAFEAACENWKKALLLSPPEDLANKLRHCLNLTIELSEILEKEI